MKKTIYLTFALCGLFLLFSCDKEGTLYKPAADRVEASFPSTKAIFSMVPEDGNMIQVELWRGNTTGAASVPVIIKDATGGVFTPEKTQFDFADGEAKAFLKIKYPDLNAFAGETYSLTITLKDEKQVSPSGISKVTVKAQRKLTMISLGKGLYQSELHEDSWDVEILKAKEADYYELVNCWGSGVNFAFMATNGKVKWLTSDSGYSIQTYGTINIKPIEVKIEGGKKLILYAEFVLPKIGHSFGKCTEVFNFPNGVVIK